MVRVSPSRVPGLAALLALAVVSVAVAQPAPPPAVHPIGDAPAELRPFIARADTIFTEIRSAHMVELTGAITAGGNAGAVLACHQAATQIIERTKRTEGLAVGRTSHRLRNPTNTPPAWAAATVKRSAGATASRVDGYYADLGDHVGVLRPIAMVGVCAGCHGPVQGLSPAVRAALADRYPADRAVDFKEGELRGWLWIEIPKNGKGEIGKGK